MNSCQEKRRPQRRLYGVCSVCYTGKKNSFAQLFYFSKIFRWGGKTSRTKHFPQTQFGLNAHIFPWINTNASAYIQFKKYMYISCFEWVHNDTQLPFEMWRHTSIVWSSVQISKLCYWSSASVSFSLFLSSQTSRFYRKKDFVQLFSSWRASNNTEQFIHKEGQKKSTRGSEIVFSQTSPLFHFHVSESWCPVRSLCRAVWSLSLLWVPGWNCLWEQGSSLFQDETGVC